MQKCLQRGNLFTDNLLNKKEFSLRDLFCTKKAPQKVAKRNPDVGRKGTSTKKDSPIFPQHLSKQQGCEKRVKGLQ